MSIAVDASSSATGSGTSGSWTHTPVGTPSCVVVTMYVWEISSGLPTMTCSYGGVDMGVPIVSLEDAGADSAHMFCLANPPTGAKTVAWTSSRVLGSFGGSAITLTGTDTSNPLTAHGSGIGNSNTLSINAAVATGQMVIDIGGQAPGLASTFTSGQTLIIDVPNGGTHHANSYATGNTTVSMSYSSNQSGAWAMGYLVLVPPASGAFNPYYYRNIAGMGG